MTVNEQRKQIRYKRLIKKRLKDVMPALHYFIRRATEGRSSLTIKLYCGTGLLTVTWPKQNYFLINQNN